MDDQGKVCPCNEALPGRGVPGRLLDYFKLSCVGVLSRVHVAVEN